MDSANFSTIHDMTETHNVFISYSWTTPKHEEWVINLAERLMADGIEVIIDKWHLKEGHDKFTFMESMVNSKDINKVLIILDKKYSERADLREGGVGTETQIISPNIYKNVSQEKFIPIVSERDENGNAFIPIFLEGRIYIDLSSLDSFEQNYENLIRNIYGRPTFNKPKLGKAPNYIFEEKPSTVKTTSILRTFDNQIAKNPNRINVILRDFLDVFYSNLADYTVVFTPHDNIEFGKNICDNINLYTELRNDFIVFFESILKSEIEFDIEIVIKFLEKLPLYETPIDDRVGSWSPAEYDNFRFIIHELFLYLVSIGLKHEKYKFIEELLYSSYFFKDKYEYKKDPTGFEKFYNHVNSIDAYYKKTFSRNFFSPMAELIITRIPVGFTKELIVEADILCHYIANINNQSWFPLTYIYNTRGRYELFDRMMSLRHFEKVKVLFNVNTPKELQDKLRKLKETDTYPNRISYTGSFDTVSPLYSVINIDSIGTTR